MQTFQRAELAAHVMGAYGAWANLINSKTLVHNVSSDGQTFSNAVTVRKDDFERILDALKEIQRLSLHAVMDLRDRGLTVPTSITDMIVGSENVSEMEPAQNSMNIVQLESNKTQFAATYAPQPIVHHTHNIDWRQNFGYKVTTGNRESMRKVMERSETNLVNGDSTIQVRANGANQVLYGYTSHPNRTTVPVDDWAVSTTNLLANVNSMMAAMYATNKIEGGPGSMMLYVPTNAWMVLRNQAFSAKGEMTFYKQILNDYPEIADIRPLIDLATGNPVLVYMAPSSVQLSIAQEPITVPHIKTLDLLPQLFTTYAVWTPLFHVDVNGLTGIVQGT